MNMDGYYLCTSGGKVVSGPYRWPREAALQVDAQDKPGDFCTMSRYALAKAGLYPRTVEGTQQLQADLDQAIGESQ